MQQFNGGALSDREDFLQTFRSFVAEWSGRADNVVNFDIGGSLKTAALRAGELGIMGQELQAAYRNAAEPQIVAQIKFNSSFASLRHYFLAAYLDCLEMIGPVTEGALQAMHPHAESAVREIIKTGWNPLSSDTIEKHFSPHLEPELRQGLETVKMNTAAEVLRRYITEDEFASDLFLHWAVTALKHGDRFDNGTSQSLASALAGRMASCYDASSLEFACSTLNLFNWEANSERVYRGMVAAIANTSQYELASVLDKASELHRQVPIPPHMANILIALIGSLPSSDNPPSPEIEKASSPFKAAAAQGGATINAIAKVTLEQIILDAPIDERRSAVTNLIRACKAYGPPDEAVVKKGTRVLAATLEASISGFLQMDKAYLLLKAMDFSPQAMAMVENHARAIPGRRDQILRQPTIGQKDYSWSKPFYSASIKVNNLTGIANFLAFFLEEKLVMNGRNVGYSLQDEIKGVAGMFARSSDRFLLQYFAQLLSNFNILHKTSPSELLSTDEVASAKAAFVRGRLSLEASRLPPQVREGIMQTFAQGYHALCGENLATANPPQQPLPVPLPASKPADVQPRHRQTAPAPHQQQVAGAGIGIYMGNERLLPGGLINTAFSGLERRLQQQGIKSQRVFDGKHKLNGTHTLGLGLVIRTEDYATAIRDEFVRCSVQAVQLPIAALDKLGEASRKFKVEKDGGAAYLTVPQGAFALHHIYAIAAALSPNEERIKQRLPEHDAQLQRFYERQRGMHTR